MKTKYVLMGLIMLSLSIPYLSFAAGNSNSESITDDRNDLEKIAKDQQADLDQRGLLVYDPDLDRYLTTVAERLWAHVQTSLSPIEIRVLRHPQADAFMYPNGICYLHTGLLVRLENEDQLAMTIAHEMVHYLRQHTLQAYHASRPDSRLSPPADTTGLDKTPDKPRQLLSNMLRSAELQADREGLELIIAAGYRPLESLQLLNRLKAILDEEAQMGITTGDTKTILNLRLEQLNKITAGLSLSTTNSQNVLAGEDFSAAISPAILANAQAGLLVDDWNLAEHNIERYLRIRPDEPRAYYLRGEILRKRSEGGHDEQALASFQRAIALNGKYAPAYRAIGLIYFKSGHTQKARNYLQAYIDLEPDAAEKQYIYSYLSLCTP